MKVLVKEWHNVSKHPILLPCQPLLSRNTPNTLAQIDLRHYTTLLQSHGFGFSAAAQGSQEQPSFIKPHAYYSSCVWFIWSRNTLFYGYWIKQTTDSRQLDIVHLLLSVNRSIFSLWCSLWVCCIWAAHLFFMCANMCVKLLLGIVLVSIQRGEHHYLYI